MLGMAEASMIKARAEFYMQVLEKNRTLKESKEAAFWHRETQKITTLKMAVDQLTPAQLNSLSRAGCQPWQGAAFNLNMNAVVTGSALKIFSESTSADDAYLKLSRLAAVKSLTSIPVDLRGDE
jgi:hypothetical protein